MGLTREAQDETNVKWQPVQEAWWNHVLMRRTVAVRADMD